MSDEYLWYRIFKASMMTQEIKKQNLLSRASLAQQLAQNRHKPMDALEVMTNQNLEQIRDEISFIDPDGIRRLKQHERATMYENEY